MILPRVSGSAGLLGWVGSVGATRHFECKYFPRYFHPFHSRFCGKHIPEKRMPLQLRAPSHVG